MDGRDWSAAVALTQPQELGISSSQRKYPSAQRQLCVGNVVLRRRLRCLGYQITNSAASSRRERGLREICLTETSEVSKLHDIVLISSGARSLMF